MQRDDSASGFSLIEVMIAVTMLAGAVVSLAELIAMATRANLAARAATRAVILAEQKMEQLKALQWAFDGDGQRVGDTTTNVAAFDGTERCPGSDAGASVGLSASPAGALFSSSDGFVDYVDAQGCGLGGGLSPPAGTVHIRRWSIAPAGSSPDTLVLQVLVTDRGVRLPDDTREPRARAPGEAWLIGMRSRKAP